MRSLCRLPNGIKIVSALQRLHGKISDVQKRDEQTDKQTNKQTDKQKKLNVFGHPGGGCNPSPAKLGAVIEDLELKLFRIRCVVSPLGGAQNLGGTRLPQLTRTHQEMR